MITRTIKGVTKVRPRVIFIILNYAIVLNLNRMKFSNLSSAIAWGIILLIVDIVIIVFAK
jgi:hypothetical protein